MQKKKSGVKKCLEICAIKGGGGGGRLMAKAILNFHFDPHPSLTFELETILSATGLAIQPGQRLYKVIRSVKSARPSLNEELNSENGP